jgi:cell division transport system permease protein
MSAAPSQQGLRARWNAWIADHRRVARESLQRLLREPLNTAMTFLVIGIALALPVALSVALGNFQVVAARWQNPSQISLYLRQAVDLPEAQQLANDLSGWPSISKVEVISKEQGLEEFRKSSGFSAALDYLGTNPLPVVMVITPAESGTGSVAAKSLFDQLRTLPAVETAKLDLDWIRKLESIIAIGQKVVLGLVILLSTGVLLIIGNTIRLAVESRRQEILVTRLVGGTDAFVRRPFLYIGMWYGLGGAIVATLLVVSGLAMLNEPVTQLAGLYGSDFLLLGLSASDLLSLWGLAILLGLAGAWLSVNAELEALEPH